MSSDIVQDIKAIIAPYKDRIEALEGEVTRLKTERTMREDWITRQAATIKKLEERITDLGWTLELYR